MSSNPINASGYGVTAVLGPTNTGKTHMAIERMVAHKSGLIGLPLRLLAREVYGRLCDKVGAANVSLVTGEERITPKNAKYQVCTVEAMPEYTNADFVAIDEVQLATDLERGHFFTDRILNLRGKHETMLLGADTMAAALHDLLPRISITTRPRMSILEYAGSKKITRMPTRSAIVAFSADEVYAIAELVRRERGGAAVVTGSLSPRTRNAQVELYQNGDVDFLIATDAIGMGLNLDVNHVAFAQDTKYDGFQFRKLTASELAQVAGRAGRHTKDGTFGITSRVQPFEEELIQALETHTFAPPNADIIALDRLSNDPDIIDITNSSERVKLLWDVVKTPDYRKISPASHAEILSQVYLDVAREGKINPIWFADQVVASDNINGELDALSTRIANIRTCTYLSNRDDWLENAIEWREKTREVEDRLSDALHETLTKRFVDRRTSILMKRLKENRMLEAEIGENGSVSVEGHAVGHLKGFRFVADASEGGKDAKALNAAATKALSAEIEKRADRLGASPNSDIVLGNDGTMRWLGEAVAKLAKGDTPLKPRIIMLADEQLTGTALNKAVARLERWISNHINTLLKPLSDLEANQELNGIARGIAFRLVENMGILARKEVADDLKNLDQDMRSIMRHNGVRFGAYHVFIPLLLKPAPSQLVCLLWAISNDKMEAIGLTEVPGLSAAIDILERLADLIRPTTSWKQDSGNEKPEGAVDGRAFYVTPAMLSILGATHEDMETILKGLGYKEEKRLEADIKPLETSNEPPAETIAPTETKTEGEATSEEPAEPKSILIWRYGGGGNKKFSNNQNANKKFSGKKNHKGNKPAQAGGHKNNKSKKPEKQADPDSPFAALAALKGNLK